MEALRAAPQIGRGVTALATVGGVTCHEHAGNYCKHVTSAKDEANCHPAVHYRLTSSSSSSSPGPTINTSSSMDLEHANQEEVQQQQFLYNHQRHLQQQQEGCQQEAAQQLQGMLTAPMPQPPHAPVGPGGVGGAVNTATTHQPHHPQQQQQQHHQQHHQQQQHHPHQQQQQQPWMEAQSEHPDAQDSCGQAAGRHQDGVEWRLDSEASLSRLVLPFGAGDALLPSMPPATWDACMAEFQDSEECNTISSCRMVLHEVVTGLQTAVTGTWQINAGARELCLSEGWANFTALAQLGVGDSVILHRDSHAATPRLLVAVVRLAAPRLLQPQPQHGGSAPSLLQLLQQEDQLEEDQQQQEMEQHQEEQLHQEQEEGGPQHQQHDEEQHQQPQQRQQLRQPARRRRRRLPVHVDLGSEEAEALSEQPEGPQPPGTASAAAAAAGAEPTDDDVEGVAKKYGEQHKLAKVKVGRYLRRADDVSEQATADLQPVQSHANVMAGVQAKVVTIAALPIKGAAFQCHLAGFDETSDEHVKLVEEAVLKLGKFIMVVNTLEEARGDLEGATAGLGAAIAAAEGQQRPKQRSAAAASSRGASASRSNPSRGAAAADAEAGPSVEAGAGPSDSEQSGGLRSAHDLAGDAPSQCNQWVIRQLYKILRFFGLLPSNKVGYCSKGCLPGLQHSDAWSKWVVPDVATTAADAAVAATAATSSLPMPGAGEAALAAAASSDATDPALPVALTAGAEGGSTVCGCGGSCMDGRRRLGFPPSMPFADYVKQDLTQERQQALLQWADQEGRQLPRAGEKVAELMDLYNQAVELRAQRPRKQVGKRSGWPATAPQDQDSARQDPPASAHARSRPGQLQHGTASASTPHDAAAEGAGRAGAAATLEPAAAAGGGHAHVDGGGVRTSTRSAQAAAAVGGVASASAAAAGPSTRLGNQEQGGRAISTSSADPLEDEQRGDTASKACVRRGTRTRHASQAAAAAAAMEGAEAGVGGANCEDEGGADTTPVRTSASRPGRGRQRGRACSSTAGRSAGPLPQLLQPLPEADAEGAEANAGNTDAGAGNNDAADVVLEHLVASSSKKRRRASVPRRVQWSFPLEVGPGPAPTVPAAADVQQRQHHHHQQRQQQQGQEAGQRCTRSRAAASGSGG